MNEEDLKKYAIEVLGLESCDMCNDSGSIVRHLTCVCWISDDSVVHFINNYKSINNLEDIELP